MSRLRRLLFLAGGWLVFVLLPGALGWWLLDRGVETLRRQSAQEARFILTQEARGIVAEAGPEVFSQRAFQDDGDPSASPAGAGIGGSPASGVRWITVREAVHELGLPELEVLQEYLGGGPPPTGRTLEALRDRLGWEIQPHFWREKPGIPIQIRWERRDAWLLWEPGSLEAPTLPRSTGSPSIRLAIILPPAAPARLTESLAQYRSRGGRGALIDLAARCWRGSPGLSPAGIRGTLRQTRNRPAAFLDLGDAIAYLERLSDQSALYLERPLPAEYIPARREFLLGLHLALFLCLSLFFPGLARSAPDWTMRPKLLGIFTYLLALPLFAVCLLSMTLLDDRTRLRETELRQTARDLLMDLDAGFRQELVATERWYRAILSDPDLQAGDYAKFGEKVRRWLSTLIVDHLEIWDWGVQRRLIESNALEDAGYIKLNELKAIRTINEALGKPSEKFFSPSMAAAWTMIENPGMGYLDYNRKPGQVHTFSFGRNTFFAFWNLAPIGTASQPAMVMAARSLQQASIRYLRRNLVTNRPLRILARDRQTSLWYPRRLRLPALDSLCDGIARSGQEQLAWVRTRRGNFLALGIGGSRLSSFDLVALIPEEQLRRDADRLRGALGLGGLCAILVGLAAALYLANTLLVPIRDISRGIHSLRAHDTEYRIPVRGHDELARLAGAFNQMLETVGEKDMARTVQESLIPQGCAAPPGYAIDLRCRMSSAIGGDYLDCFPLSGNRMVFLVGDVSGHGVGSALVMAMAKAMVFLHFAEDGPAETLLVKLNTILYDLTLPNQMMCFCIGVLDTATHDGRLFLAGNPYPVLWEAGPKRAQFLGAPGYPLGIRQQRQFPPIPFHLEPGDLLFLYTDGLIEAIDQEGRPFGFPRALQLVATWAPEGPAVLGREMEEALAVHVNKAEMLDDLSLLTIGREARLVTEEVA